MRAPAPRLTALALLLLLPRTSPAQGLPEQEFGEPWNGVGAGARALGMGGAFTAISDDLGGVYWNPAGLAKMRDTQAGLMTGSPYLARVRGEAEDTAFAWGSFGFITTAFKPWAAGLSAVRNFHSESLVPWQENYYIGTFVFPFNAARTAAVGLNVKLVTTDHYYQDPRNDDAAFGLTDFETPTSPPDHLFKDFSSVSGWGLDVGALFGIPFPVRDRIRNLNFGLMVRNIGRARIQAKNQEKALPAQVQFGAAWSMDDLIPRERSIFAFNYDLAAKGSLGGLGSQVRIGMEQWFLRNYGALRLGYAAPSPVYDKRFVATSYYFQGRPVMTGGVTLLASNPAARVLLGLGLGAFADSVQVDVAGTLPVEAIAGTAVDAEPENAIERFAEPPNSFKPVDRARLYVQVTYHWSPALSSPYAKVTVEPLVFAPKKGEVAVFTLDYRDEGGIESWELEIRNSARVPVRSFSGLGAPPGRLVWDGMDDRFNRATDDDHTYTLKVRNRDGVETVTAPQSVRIFTPGEGPRPGDPTKLYQILEETAKREEAAKAAVKPLVNEQLKAAKAPLTPGEPGSATDMAPETPGGPEYLLPGTESPSSTSSEAPGVSATLAETSFRGLEAAQVVRFDVPAGPDGRQAVLEYTSQQRVFKYLAREIRNLTEQSFAAVGTSAGSFLVQARYGNHLLTVETPMEVARGLKQGRLDERQWLRAAAVTLDAKPILPVLE